MVAPIAAVNANFRRQIWPVVGEILSRVPSLFPIDVEQIVQSRRHRIAAAALRRVAVTRRLRYADAGRGNRQRVAGATLQRIAVTRRLRYADARNGKRE